MASGQRKKLHLVGWLSDESSMVSGLNTSLSKDVLWLLTARSLLRKASPKADNPVAVLLLWQEYYAKQS